MEAKTGGLGEPTPSEIAAKIAKAPALRAEAEAFLPALDAVLHGQPDPYRLAALLMEQALAYGIEARGKTDAALDAKWALYGRALGDYPVALVEMAFRAWENCELYVGEKTRHSFFPQSAELKILADMARKKLVSARYIAAKAIERPPEVKKVSAEERKAVAADFADLAKSLRAKAPPNPSGPIRPAGGMSPQQAAARLRQSAEVRARRTGTDDSEVIL